MQPTLTVLELNIFQNKLKGNKNIITNIYIVQAYCSIMCKYFCIGFSIGKSLMD